MCAGSKTVNAGSRINTWLKRMNLFELIQFSNKSFLLIVSALSLLSLAACSRISDGKELRSHVISELLDSAEAVMNDNPESVVLAGNPKANWKQYKSILSNE